MLRTEPLRPRPILTSKCLNSLRLKLWKALKGMSLGSDHREEIKSLTYIVPLTFRRRFTVTGFADLTGR